MAYATCAGSLDGAWDSEITINPQSLDIALTADLALCYSISTFAFDSLTTLDASGWADQAFDATGTLGAITVFSAIDFAPAAGDFESWVSTASISLAGAVFSGTFTLEPGVTQLTISSQTGEGAPVQFQADVILGSGEGCDLDFNSMSLRLIFPIDECVSIESSIRLGYDGFEYAILATEDIAVPGLPWMTIDATVEFEADAKAMALSPSFDFGPATCFDLYMGVSPEEGLTTDAVLIDGIGLSYELGGLRFAALSYWGEGDKPGLLADTEYWQVASIHTLEVVCCGPFAFDAAVYFLEGGARLFDAALIDADLAWRATRYFAVDTGLQINLETAAFSEWTIGVAMIW